MSAISKSIDSLDSKWETIKTYYPADLRMNLTKIQEQAKIILERFSEPSAENSSEIVIIGGEGKEPLKDKLLCKNFGKFNMEESGSLFAMAPWSIPINDLFILACIEAKKEFHIQYGSFAEIPDKQLWHPTKHHLRGFARELVMLLSAGYQAQKEIELVLAPPKEDRGEITLITLLQNMPELTSLEAVRAYLKERDPT
ncbi:MAG: hypothetical protein JSS61_01265 [Verrucomicrobia bacterium]|nr:hypothetical protein [Verrucomicrobiota bacterium]